MQDYVAGFLVNTEKTHIVLIHKNRGPQSIIGKWTGVGGKVEKTETPRYAQEREFREEAGLWIPDIDWTYFASFNHSKYFLRFYFCFKPMEELLKCRTMEDEEVAIIPLAHIHNYDLAYGARFLIPLLLSDFVMWPIDFEINGNRED